MPLIKLQLLLVTEFILSLNSTSTPYRLEICTGCSSATSWVIVADKCLSGFSGQGYRLFHITLYYENWPVYTTVFILVRRTFSLVFKGETWQDFLGFFCGIDVSFPLTILPYFRYKIILWLTVDLARGITISRSALAFTLMLCAVGQDDSPFYI